MTKRTFRFLSAGIFGVVLFSIASIALSWTGPSEAPTGGNVAAPVNVGPTAQTKSGVLGVDGLAVFGNTLLSGTSRYLNFGTIPTPSDPSTGYGLRDSDGTLQYKNNGGNWLPLGAALGWVVSGTNVYKADTAGNVGIGTASPDRAKVQIRNVAAGLYGLSMSTDNTGRGMELVTQDFVSGTVGSAIQMDTMAGTGNVASRIQAYTAGKSQPGNLLLQNAGGNVGIGTTNPGNIKLHVTGSVSGDYVAAFDNSGTHGAMGRGTTYGLVGYSTTGSGYGVLGQSSCGTSSCAGVYGASGSYYATIGRADGYSLVGNGAVYASSFIYSSDKRLKENIQPLDKGILTLMQLNPVSFTWKKDIDTLHAGQNDIGFIAQDVEKIVPEVVQTDGKTGYKTIDYPRLVPILVQAIQEQQKEIETLKADVAALKNMQ
jgi:hypothetical protein